MLQIELTKSQCENLSEFIEMYFYQAIREDLEIDCLDWARDLLDAEKALRKAANDELR